MPEKAIRLNRHRYCQALMRARDGESVLLDAEGISCPAAAAAFGFRPLPENLKNGKGLVGFGIVQKQATGQQMFTEMSYLPPGAIAALHIYPLNQSNEEPDAVVIEDEAEKLMWINLAYLNITGGQRVQSSTAVLQATCVGATIIPWREQRLTSVLAAMAVGMPPILGAVRRCWVSQGNCCRRSAKPSPSLIKKVSVHAPR